MFQNERWQPAVQLQLHPVPAPGQMFTQGWLLGPVFLLSHLVKTPLICSLPLSTPPQSYSLYPIYGRQQIMLPVSSIK